MKALDRHILLIGGVILISCLVAYRSFIIPITHDEASTWLNFRNINLWSCYENYFCWQTANNHWFNTLLMQWSARIFGDSLWALRLPNVLAGILYCYAAALISARYIKNVWLQLAGFFLLAAHLYLLDFFSLCRGYGLMGCGIIWGVYFLLRYIDKYELRWLVFSVSVLFLAVLSNFTALLPFASVGFVWLLWMIGSKKISLVFRHGLVWMIGAALIAWWSAYPIRLLANEGEFGWGSESLFVMFTDLTKNMLYGIVDTSNPTYLVIVWIIFSTAFAASCLGLVVRWFVPRRQLLFLVALLIINLLFIVLNQIITGSSTPVGRKTIYLIPLLFLPIVIGLNLIRHKALALLMTILISGALLLHIFRPHVLGSSREWYYDAYYPQLFSALSLQGGGDSIRLGSSWIFYPALAFYQNTQSLPISGLVYQKPMVIDTGMQYYYVETPDTIGMHAHGFVLDKNIGPYFLYRKTGEHIPMISPGQ